MLLRAYLPATLLLVSLSAPLSAQIHSGDDYQELERLHQLQQELTAEISRLQHQLESLNREQLQYLEQSQELRRQLLQQRQQSEQPLSAAH